MAILFNLDEINVMEENNSELKQLIEGYKVLEKEYNTINLELKNHEVTIINSIFGRSRINDLKKRIDDLQKTMLDWETKALTFLHKPNIYYSYKSPADENKVQQLQNHIFHIMTLTRSDVMISREILITNWNNLRRQNESIINYYIAIGSFILAFIGLIIALIS